MTGMTEPQAEFRRGLKESIPMVIGFVPLGLILGVQGAQKGMVWPEMLLMTGMNFAGGSEFAAVNLWQHPLPVLLIATVTLMINSRHILMGAAFAPHLRTLPMKKALPALFFMCDESWAMGLADARKNPAGFSWNYYMGVCAMLYTVWVASSAAGTAAGPLLGDVSALGFGMVFPAVFLVLIRGMWKSFASSRPWFVSLAVAAAVYLAVGGAWYVPAGALAGLASAWYWGERA